MKRFTTLCAGMLLLALAACDNGGGGDGAKGPGGQGGNSANSAPTAADDTATTAEDTMVVVAVTDNDSDPDDDLLTISSFTQPSHGTVSRLGDSLRFVPAANFHGEVSFSYSIADLRGGSGSASVTITVTPVNDNPVAVDDAAETDQDTPVDIAVLANDSDVDGDGLQATTASATNGSAAILPGGVVRFTPSQGFFGDATVNYGISDANGGTAGAIVTVTVNDINDAPVAADDSFNTMEDSPATFNVLANDTDADNDPPAVSITVQPAHGAAVVNPNKTITYKPALNYFGADSFQYQVDDGRGGTDSAMVAATVLPVNDAPVAADDTMEVVQPNAMYIAVLANDTDIDGDLLRVLSVTQPTHGGVAIQLDGTVKYTPHQGYKGPDSFTYICTDRPDNGGLNATATVTLNVKLLEWNIAWTSTLQTQKETYAVVCEDFNGDGLQDIAGSDAGVGTLCVFLCAAATPGQAAQYLARADYPVAVLLPTCLVAADINGDGLLDLAMGGLGGIHILYNNPANPGTFIASINTVASAQIDFPYPLSLDVADINGDGKPDIVAAENWGAVGILINTTPPDNVADIPGIGVVRYTQMTLTEITPSSNINFLWCAIAADFDSDGKPDIAVCYIRDLPPGGLFQGMVGILRNTSTALAVSFAPVHELASPSPLATTPMLHLAAGDLNGDGKADVAVRMATPDLLVALNTSSKGSLSFGDYANFAAASDDYQTGFAGIQIADMNNDGRADLVATNGRNNSVSVLYNLTASGASVASFGAQNEFAIVGVIPYKVRVKDLNGDGIMDIVATSEFSIAGNYLTLLTGKLE